MPIASDMCTSNNKGSKLQTNIYYKTIWKTKKQGPELIGHFSQILSPESLNYVTKTVDNWLLIIY
jgi:hypothetical protein